jgi:hypothetical protein
VRSAQVIVARTKGEDVSARSMDMGFTVIQRGST